MNKVFELLAFSDLLKANGASNGGKLQEDCDQLKQKHLTDNASQQALRCQERTDGKALINAQAGGIDDMHSLVAATVIFEGSLTAAGIETLAGRYRLDIASVQAQLYGDNDGRRLVLAVGPAAILLLENSLPLSMRLEMAVSRQYLMLTGAQCRSSQAADLNTWRFYRADVITTEDMAKRLLSDFAVAAVVLHKTQTSLAGYFSIRQMLSRLESHNCGERNGFSAWCQSLHLAG